MRGSFIGRPRLIRRSGAEHGFTLIETLVALTLSLLVFGAVTGMLAIVSRLDSKNTQRVAALDSASIAMSRLVRDLRQATAINPVVSAASITYQLAERPAGEASSIHTVTVSCPRDATDSLYSCTRSDLDPVTNLTTTATAITGLTSGNVFRSIAPVAPQTIPSIAISLSQAIVGYTNPVVLNDVVSPRI